MHCMLIDPEEYPATHFAKKHPLFQVFWLLITDTAAPEVLYPALLHHMDKRTICYITKCSNYSRGFSCFKTK